MTVEEIVLENIPTGQESAIYSGDLVLRTGIGRRQLKKIITKLRKQYPIVSKETDGGGYWIATTREEIIEFIAMIKRRRNAYNVTINEMLKYIT